jgi:hypothetical protein
MRKLISLALLIPACLLAYDPPANVVVNASNPATSGLVYLSYLRSGNHKDIVNGTACVAQGTTVFAAPAGGDSDTAMKADGGNLNETDYSADAAGYCPQPVAMKNAAPTATGWTFAFRSRITTLTDFSRLFGILNANGDIPYYVASMSHGNVGTDGVGWFTKGSQVQFSAHTSTATPAVNSVYIVDSSFHDYVMTLNESTNKVKFYVDGAKVADMSPDASGTVGKLTGFDVNNNPIAFLSFGIAGEANFAAVWSRDLGDAGVAEMSSWSGKYGLVATEITQELDNITLGGFVQLPYVTVAPSGACNTINTVKTLINGTGQLVDYGCSPTTGTACPCTWVQKSGGSGSASDATVTFTDITTNNASTTKHGFAPKLPNDATKYYNGTGAWTVPAGVGGGVVSVTGAGVSTDGSGNVTITTPADVATFGGTNTFTGADDFSGVSSFRAWSGPLASRPTACTQGWVYFVTDATAGSNWTGCVTTGSPGTWATLGGGGSSTDRFLAQARVLNISGVQVPNGTGAFPFMGSVSGGSGVFLESSNPSWTASPVVRAGTVGPNVCARTYNALDADIVFTLKKESGANLSPSVTFTIPSGTGVDGVFTTSCYTVAAGVVATGDTLYWSASFAGSATVYLMAVDTEVAQ